MKQERTYQMYFDDILMAIDRILEYTQDCDFAGFKRDYKTVDAVIRNFEIIGEAAKNIPVSIKEMHPEVPWDEMYYLRNRISATLNDHAVSLRLRDNCLNRDFYKIYRKGKTITN